MASKITLAPWPGTSQTKNVIPEQALSVEVVYLTESERSQMLESIECLHFSYQVGLNRLMRAVGFATDLRTIFQKWKQVRADIVEEIAQVTGMSVPELLSIKTLDVSRQGELRSYLKENNLTEPVRGYKLDGNRSF